MPRAETTPSRRKKRDAQPRASQGLARTAASVRAAAMANINAGGSISAPIVKRESMPTLIPAATSAKTAVSSPPRSWRHPDELPYIRNAGKTWDDMTIVRFLVVNAFSIPARSPNSMEPWVHVRCADGSEVILPRGYRLPLLWVAKYLWTSVKLVLTADDRQREWDSTKFEILHIARLCAGLLSQARAQIDEGGGIERGWRCALFDRALHRYWHEWLIMRDEFVRDFFREFGEEEYQNDILKYVWSRWVIKGHKGFTLATKEVADGITANEFMDGFVVGGDAGTFEWRESPSDMAEPTPEVQVDTVESKTTPQTQPDVPVPEMIPQIQPDVPIPQTIPQNQPDISVPPVTIAAKPPAPSHVVSFLVRPRAFRASSHRSSPDVQSPFSTGTNPAHNTTPVDDSPVTPAMQEAPPVPATQSRVESPSYVPMAVDTVAVQSHSQTSTSNSPENETRPSLPPQRIPLPGERRRAQASGKSTLVERSRAVSTDSGAKIEVDVEMQANTPKTPEEQEIRVVGVAPTAMGSLRPGSGVLRGHSEDENRNDGQSASPPQQAQEEEESEEESEDDEMQDAPQKPETENIHLANRVEDIATDDLELDGDLELLYPDHAVSPVDNWGSASQAGRETSSGSNSASPSISPVLPPLSSARFPAAADGMTTSTELTVYPHAYAGQELEATDPGIVTRFLQSCGMLGDEMRALRAEVAQLRTERAAPEIQLEERVRRLEEREAPVARPSEPSGLGGRRWSHPLQHLISTEDLEMDVDVVVSPQADGTNIMTKYGSVDGGEPLPPRSRKFNSTPRFTGM